MDHKDTFNKTYSNFILGSKKTCFGSIINQTAHSDKMYLKLFFKAKEKIDSKSDLVSLKFWYDWARGKTFIYTYLYSLIDPAVVVLVLCVHIRTLCNLKPCKFSNGA